MLQDRAELLLVELAVSVGVEETEPIAHVLTCSSCLCLDGCHDGLELSDLSLDGLVFKLL